MSAPDDPDLWSKIATGAAGVAASLAGLVWGDMKHRLNSIESVIYKKAEKEEMDRQRDNVNTLFDKLDEQARRSDGRFTEVIELINERHLQVIAKLDTKQDKPR